jgi:hypothetical protein
MKERVLLLVIFVSALVTEFCSTLYISAVSEKDAVMMASLAFFSPFLNLPFLWVQIDAKKNNHHRLFVAFIYGLGYLVGSIITTLL